MKTTIFIIITVFAYTVSNTYAQVIPNYNFENWTNGANNAPDGWSNDGSNHVGFYPVTQTSDKYFGNYAVRLENKITSTDTTGAEVRTKRPNNQQGFGPAFPIATRYNNLKGFYKFTPQNGDSAQIIVYITKTGFVGPWGNLLAWGQKQLSASATYAPFSVGYMDSQPNFVYNDNVLVPDSGFIAISAYKDVGTAPGVDYDPLGNSVLIIDALNFDSYLSGINEHLDITSSFHLFPTFNTGAFDVTFETAKTDYTTITIYDLNGKKATSLFSGNLNAGYHTMHYDAHELINGTYLFVVATGEGYKAEKFTIIK